jgi:hypothetical protein
MAAFQFAVMMTVIDRLGSVPKQQEINCRDCRYWVPAVCDASSVS